MVLQYFYMNDVRADTRETEIIQVQRRVAFGNYQFIKNTSGEVTRTHWRRKCNKYEENIRIDRHV